MRFLHPEILWLLVPIIVLGLFSLYRIVTLRKNIKRFGEYELVRRLMPDLSLRRRMNKDFMLLSVATLLVLAAARPQMGTKEETIEKRGIEVMICLDLSNSMLSQDVAPSRLSIAKNIVSRLTDKLTEDKLGLIFFTSSAYVQLPITNDIVSGKMFLEHASPEIMPDQGTDIANALRLASRSFSTSEDEKIGRTVIVISDVEDHSQKAVDMAKELAQKGIAVNIIGVGSDNGGPISIPGEGYVQDAEGQMVISKVNDELGKELASAGNGLYVRATNVSGAVSVLTKALEKMQKADFKQTIYSTYDEKFAWFLLPALLLLIVESIYLNRKNRWIKRVNLFDSSKNKPEK
ncbi:VWA domain-containing protein [Porphyromonas sp. COT-108 OH1349]|uniref:vWA domain-containing protein n=1 Tax=Porphyromonas sp. COT-108 OH1349 TaxID=1537504 RepID=UPI00052C8BEC|nr:VWA domain-containing protein [Porphyromonas sp. COT-108 OH1349]KGN70531.1 membrane protein [Porphyromonas sp. COT-108 OH1349]